MPIRDYVAPVTVEEAVRALQGSALARPFAGGTDLIVQVRERRKDAEVMVDLKAIPELTSISFAADGSLRIGAAAPCAAIYHNQRIATAYPALIDSASLIGGIQIQSRASLGGNLCNSSPAADSIPTLIALAATCEIAGSGGRRTVPVEEFCTGPGANVLKPGEVLVALNFPAPARPLRRRLRTLHPPQRDGHRRRERGGQRHPFRRWLEVRGREGRHRRSRANPAARAGCRQRRSPASPSPPRPLRRAAAAAREAATAHHRHARLGRPAPPPRRRPHRPRHQQGCRTGEGPSDETDRDNNHQRRGGGIPRCARTQPPRRPAR